MVAQVRLSRVGVHARRLILVVGAVLLVAGSWTLASRASVVTSAVPFDFNLNWVAAQRLVDHDDLYDRDASRAQAVHDVGSFMRVSNHGPYSSFIGTPSVALVHTPFLIGGHDDDVAAFRLAALLGMLGAIVITARALPLGWRSAGALIGAGALMLSWPLASTLWIGQGNEFVMLALAFAVLGISRGSWRVVGVALGVAAVLKVTPLFLIVYLIARNRRQVVVPAIVSACALSVVAALVGRPGDTWEWVRHVLPSVSNGSLYVGNQSLVGWLARITTPVTSIESNWTLGNVHYMSWLVIGGAGYALWRLRRHAPVVPLELGAGVLILLFAGPLSWDHYFVWACVPLVLMIDPRCWARRSRGEVASWVVAIGAAIALLVVRIPIPSPAAVHANPLVRWYGSPYTVAVILLTLVAFRQLRQCAPRADAGVKRPSRAADTEVWTLQLSARAAVSGGRASSGP